jgi:hypothetical protein
MALVMMRFPLCLSTRHDQSPSHPGRLRNAADPLERNAELVKRRTVLGCYTANPAAHSRPSLVLRALSRKATTTTWRGEMASRTSTPRSQSRSSTGSSGSSDDTMMLDAPPQSPSRPVRLRNPSTSHPSTASQAASFDPSFSLLLSLPRELRERIYTFALTSPRPLPWPCSVSLKDDVSVTILRTNKQVHEESVPILYSANTFVFTHPSDCNIFRVIASPASHNIMSVYFRIREKDLRLWTSYLGSKAPERSLKFDLPKLKHVSIFMRCGAIIGRMGFGANMATPGPANLPGLPPNVALQVQAVQHALSQHIQALHNQTRNPTDDVMPAIDAHDNQIPPPPPPPPAMPFLQFQQGGLPHHHPQPPPQNLNIVPQPLHHHAPPPFHAAQHVVYSSFLRFERELGVESLCLSLQETRRKETQVKIVCTIRIPRREVERMYRLYPEDLEMDSQGTTRTRPRKLHNAEVSLEIGGYEMYRNT